MVTVIIHSFSNYFPNSSCVPRTILVTGDWAVSSTDTWRMAYVLEGQ